MNTTRILVGVIGFPIVAVFLALGNVILIDIAFAIVAAMSIHEYYKSFKGKANPITWVGYLASALIAVIHIIPKEYLVQVIGILLPAILLILFVQSIVTNMKRNIVDLAVTLFGICYIPLFLMFIPIIRGGERGQYLVWFVMLSGWGTDVFAYALGKLIGKHKLTPISPNKTIEGSIGGILGSIIMNLGYTLIINNLFQLNLPYLNVIIIAITLSILSQIGDLAASSIKRYVEIKDFSNLIPGHGGLLDRIDSIIFVAPFAYYLIRFLL